MTCGRPYGRLRWSLAMARPNGHQAEFRLAAVERFPAVAAVAEGPQLEVRRPTPPRGVLGLAAFSHLLASETLQSA